MIALNMQLYMQRRLGKDFRLLASPGVRQAAPVPRVEHRNRSAVRTLADDGLARWQTIRNT